jgi:hypothetical protein
VPSGIPGKSGGLLYPKSNPALGKTVTDADSGSWDYGTGEDMTSLGSQGHLKYASGNYRMVEIPSGLAKKGKVNQATITDLRGRKVGSGGNSMIAVEDPSLGALSDGEVHRSSQKVKRDSETNTDHSALMMHKTGQGQRGLQVPGFGMRPMRPGSASSTGSSPRPLTGAEQLAQRNGERLSNYRGSSSPRSLQSSPREREREAKSDVEAYTSGTLERKKKVSSNTQTSLSAANNSLSSPEDYRSNTLGRRKPEGNLKEKLFGSRGSLHKMSSAEGNNMCYSTIISNPHATFTKPDGTRVTPGRSYSVDAAGNAHNYVNIDYLSPGYLPSRPLSGLSSPTNTWMKYGGGSGQHPNMPMRMALSETESMESIYASSIQAQIQQARAAGIASRNILQGVPGVVHRSDSFRSSKSEKMCPMPPHNGEGMMQRTNSFSHMNSSQPSSPTGSQCSSSKFGYPVSAISPSGTQSLGRGSSQTGIHYGSNYMPLSKLSGSKEDDCELPCY